NPDPLLRFAIIESMEAAGNLFFQQTVGMAEELATRTGKPFPYFGKYHFDRETGHLQNGDERLFFRAPMSAAQRAKAHELVERVFAVFELHFTSWQRYARALHEKRWSFEPSTEGRASGTMRAHVAWDPSGFMSLEHPGDLTGPGRGLAAARRAAYE